MKKQIISSVLILSLFISQEAFSKIKIREFTPFDSTQQEVQQNKISWNIFKRKDNKDENIKNVSDNEAKTETNNEVIEEEKTTLTKKEIEEVEEAKARVSAVKICCVQRCSLVQMQCIWPVHGLVCAQHRAILPWRR
ncbi:MAG: hypothetical protein MJ180_04995 [Candidatus Gastranaerophilales bacterium]|nr:hypothetical protein [Candidatus Gastranaerophilales bacterium]